MEDRQFDALVAAASDAAVPADEPGVEFDGLRVDRTDDGFSFDTPETTATGLSRVDLRDRAADSPYVRNWFFWEWTVRSHDSPRRAFCRRAEGAPVGADADDTASHGVPERDAALREGMVTEWGQLRIEATLAADGTRRYEVRHVDEADADPGTLTDHDDPLDAREIAERDARDRYRPLKTAPTLAGGWRFPDLDWQGLARTVETFYPATVANWYREQTGQLDVDHWRDTVGRQSGIYGVVKTWDRGEGYDHVNWVAEACCDDSQCLKRREWQYDDDTDLDVDGGDGAFPCREPCSVVITAARKWTRLESEVPETYEFELTPSEKEQLEATLDAVADGRIDEIREADVKDDANRYRARFLRAKLFEDGNLAGVPTEPDDD
ncbi:MAG: hypothetical protein J07HB67_00789 [halophilic archaeon J07HB67]|jgi:hypothetical protein|nr:MAG: hypothetical protein J07HB67_00789 [halophilic archaeon J07HB67]